MSPQMSRPARGTAGQSGTGGAGSGEGSATPTTRPWWRSDAPLTQREREAVTVAAFVLRRGYSPLTVLTWLRDEVAA